MMTDDTERLVVALEARVRDFERNMQKAERTGTQSYQGLKRGSSGATRQMEADMSRSASRVNQSLASVSSKIGSYGKAFAGAFAGGLAAGGVAAIVGQVGELARAVAEVGDQAKIAGVNVKSFQELKYVAEQSRIGVDALTDGLKEMNLRADEFILTKAGSAAEAFQRLGFTAETLKDKLKDPSALFTEIIGKLGKLDRAAQIRIADEVFGGTGGEVFVKLIGQGEAGIRSQIKAANDLGIVMDEQLITRAAEIDKRFSQIATTVGMTLKSAIVSAADSLMDFIDGFRDFQNQQKSTLQDRQAELGMRRLELENLILETQNNSALSVEKRNKAIGTYRIELQKVAQEEAKIVDILNGRNKTERPAESTWTPPSSSGFPVPGSNKNVSPVTTARSYIGTNEQRDSDVLKTLFKQANVSIDPKIVPWCAAFVNAVLATNGLKGTGSLAARSFLDYGQKTDDPKRGDIVVLKRGQNAAEGHVGFFEGYDEKGNVRVLGGNQSHGVNVKSYDRKNVLGYRSIPGAAEGDINDTLTSEIERRNKLKDSYDGIVASAKEFIAEQGLESQSISMTKEAAAKLRYEQQLLTEAQRAGLELTPQQTANLKELAASMAAAEVQSNALAKSQYEMKRAAEEFAALGKDVTKGFVSDLMHGTSAANAFATALQKIADKLLDDVLDAIFQVNSAGSSGGGGGLLGSIFKGIGSMFGGGGASADPWSGLRYAKGGIHDNGRSVPLKRFATGGVSDKAAIFGEAGPEAAVPLPDGRRIPVDLRGAGVGGGSQKVQVDVGVSVDTDGNLQAYVKRISQTESASAVQNGLEEYNQTLPDRIQHHQQNPRIRG